MRKPQIFLPTYLILHVFFPAEGSLSVCSDLLLNTIMGPEDSTTGILSLSGEICRGRCRAEKTCNAWSWNKGTTMCYLFETSDSQALPGFTSGEKHCKGDAL